MLFIFSCDVLFALCSLKDAVKEAIESTVKLFPKAKNIGYYTDLMNKAIELAYSDTRDIEAIHQLGEGWVAEEMLAIAVFCALRYEKDFDKAIRCAVNHNGDSDSTGAVTGNILGTYIGYSKDGYEFNRRIKTRTREKRYSQILIFSSRSLGYL